PITCTSVHVPLPDSDSDSDSVSDSDSDSDSVSDSESDSESDCESDSESDSVSDSESDSDSVSDSVSVSDSTPCPRLRRSGYSSSGVSLRPSRLPYISQWSAASIPARATSGFASR
ncbi:MAG: hypothetical protein AB7P00_21580, partial [Sandaracinaceae bacterium]